MATNPAVIKVDGERLAHALQQASEKLDSAEGELILDFSSVRRIDLGGLAAIEKLASQVEGKSLKVVLRGVNVDVYKVLKLVKLTPRFSFVN